jgi:uncharacterized protein
VSSIPIFPLPNTVVFPGMTVPLYVFEARYRNMVNICLEQERPRFIISLSKDNETIRDEVMPFYPLGTIVHILQVSKNPDGTFNILGHGQERCHINIESREDITEPDGISRPLFFGSNKIWNLERNDPNQERLIAWDTLETFQSYAKTFFAFEGANQIEKVIPEDLVYQASFICANIRIPADSRQILLEAPSLIKRFQLAQKMMLERLAAHQPTKDVN